MDELARTHLSPRIEEIPPKKRAPTKKLMPSIQAFGLDPFPSTLPYLPLPFPAQPQGLLQHQEIPFQELGPVLNVANLLQLDAAGVGHFLVPVALLFQRTALLRHVGFLLRDRHRIGVDVGRARSEVAVERGAYRGEGGGEGGARFQGALRLAERWSGGGGGGHRIAKCQGLLRLNLKYERYVGGQGCSEGFFLWRLLRLLRIRCR